MSGSAFPGAPRLLKGSIVVFGADVPVPTGLVVFQYNPETVTRRVESGAKNDGQAPAAADPKGALGGPPTETISMTVELSSVDALEGSEPVAMALGLHPQLAQLESLMYPSAAIEVLNKGLVLAGIAAVAPAKIPLVLLAWGATRIVPVRVVSVSITETQFDARLNPIHAKVDLSLRVLVYNDLADHNPVFSGLPLVRTIAREALAAQASLSNLGATVDISL